MVVDFERLLKIVRARSKERKNVYILLADKLSQSALIW